MTDFKKIQEEANAEIRKEFPLIRHAIDDAYYVEVILRVADRLSGKFPPSKLGAKTGKGEAQ